MDKSKWNEREWATGFWMRGIGKRDQARGNAQERIRER